MSLALQVYKGSRRPNTLQIKWESIHQSVLIVMSPMGDDLIYFTFIIYCQNKVSKLYIWSAMFVKGVQKKQDAYIF